MGYVFVLLAIFANVAKGASSKFVSGNISTVRQNSIFNGVRNVLSMIIALFTVLAVDASSFFTFHPIELVLCGVSGLSMAVFTITWIFAIKGEAYMLVSACSSASFIVPCIFGLLVFKESVSLFEFIAFLIIVLAIAFLLRYNFTLNGRLKIKDAVLLFLVFLSSGLNNAMQKAYTVEVIDKNVGYHTFYTFAFAALFMLLAAPLFKSANATPCKNIVKSNFKFLLIMAFGNFFANYFQGLAAKTVDAIVLYPLISALSLIAGSFMAAVMFKERVTKNCVIGVVLVGIALILSRF